jgi:hypothetical protein
MSGAQALEVLGLIAGTTNQEVRAAYNRLMKRLHPDVGGSDFFAKQLNDARDVLLGQRHSLSFGKQQERQPQLTAATEKICYRRTQKTAADLDNYGLVEGVRNVALVHRGWNYFSCSMASSISRSRAASAPWLAAKESDASRLISRA